MPLFDGEVLRVRLQSGLPRNVIAVDRFDEEGLFEFVQTVVKRAERAVFSPLADFMESQMDFELESSPTFVNA